MQQVDIVHVTLFLRISVVALCVTQSGRVCAQAPEALARDVIAARQAIRTIDVSLHTETTITGPEGRPAHVEERDVRIVADFDVPRMRLEHSDYDSALIDCIGCLELEEDSILRYSVPQHDDGSLQPHVEIKYLDDPDASAYLILDPRLIGIVPAMTFDLVHHSFASYLGALAGQRLPNVTIEPSLERTTLAGLDCQVVRVTARHAETGTINNTWRAWFSQEHGDSVVRMEAEFSSGDASIRDELECELEQHQPTGIWFPRSVEIVRSENGAPVWREETQITLHSLNTPIEPAEFSFTGNDGIPIGTRVLWSSVRPAPSKVNLVWSETGPMSLGGSLIPDEDNQQRTRWRLLLVLNTLFLLVVIVLVILRRRRAG